MGKQEEQVKERKRKERTIEDKIWYRNFGIGDKWLPGEIRSNEGIRNWMIQGEEGQQMKRHEEQIIERTESGKSNPAEEMITGDLSVSE